MTPDERIYSCEGCGSTLADHPNAGSWLPDGTGSYYCPDCVKNDKKFFIDESKNLEKIDRAIMTLSDYKEMITKTQKEKITKLVVE